MKAGTQAYRQTHTGRLEKAKAKGKAYDLKATFTQNDTKVAEKSYRVDDTIIYLWVPWTSGASHFVPTHSPQDVQG